MAAARQNPEQKNLLVVDAKTGARVTNVVRGAITRETGDIVFQPTSGQGRYFVYYLPNVGSGRSNYPKVVYPEPEKTAERRVARETRRLGRRPRRPEVAALPRARVVEFQAIDELNSFYPMEVIATAAETQALLARHAASAYLLFPEDRRFPIRMTDDPAAAVDRSRRQRAVPRRAPTRGEFYAFQVGVLAAREAVERLGRPFQRVPRRPAGGPSRPRLLRCVNTGRHGTGPGGTFKKTRRPCRRARCRRCGSASRCPRRPPPGDYEGEVTSRPQACRRRASRSR